MKRRGSSALVAGALLVGIVIATVGALSYEGSIQQQSTGGSAYNIGADISGGFSMLKDGLSFASGGGLAQVQTNGVGLIADTFTGDNPLAPTCSTTPKNSYIALTNKGSANGTATGVTITYGGAKNIFAIAGLCTIGPSGSSTATMYLLFGGPSKLANSAVPQPGNPYLGTVTMSSGAQLPFTGSWFQGYPQISTTGVALTASDFTKGKPTNSTCGATPAAANQYIVVNNTGTVGASVTGVTITWKDATNTFPVIGSCSVGPDGTPSAITYILFGAKSNLSVAAEAGQPFNGTVTLSFGTPIPFSGKFQ